MASAKDIQRKERRKLSERKKIITIIAVLVLIAAVTVGVIFAINYFKDDGNIVDGNGVTVDDPNNRKNSDAGTAIVATIDGNPITEAEFLYYFLNQIYIFEQTASLGGAGNIWSMPLDGETMEDFAKQKTLTDIMVLKEQVRRAKEEGLELSAQKLTQTEEMAAFYESTIYTEEFTKVRGVNVDVLKQCMADEAYVELLFETYTADFVPEEQDGYADELARRIQADIEFWRNKAIEEGTMELFEWFTDKELEEMKERVTNDYVNDLKKEYFETISASWTENITIDINHDVFDNITVENTPRHR